MMPVCLWKIATFVLLVSVMALREELKMFFAGKNLGLADGAGGNRSFGINPADFSQAILASCRSILRQSNVHPNQLPRLILSAMQQVEASRIRGTIRR